MNESMNREIEHVLQEISDAATRCGRKPSDVTLMGVSKTHPYEAVLDAFESGIRIFGENRVQEVVGKFPSYAQRPADMQLHLIGHLQSNKVAKIVPLVDSIDSIDSLKIASLVSSCALDNELRLPVLLEFNTSGESAKSGFASEDELYQFLDVAGSLEGILIQGLMTVGPLGGDEMAMRKAFAKLRDLQSTCRIRYPHLMFDTLSMGMSGDFVLAIEEGSTLVRIGTRIFGARDYTK